MDENQKLLALLSVIHRDGGHHLVKHGLEHSCLDAEKIVRALREKVAELEDSIVECTGWFLLQSDCPKNTAPCTAAQRIGKIAKPILDRRANGKLDR